MAGSFSKQDLVGLRSRMRAMVNKIEKFNQTGGMEGGTRIRSKYFASMKQDVLDACESKYDAEIRKYCFEQSMEGLDELQVRIRGFINKIEWYNQSVARATMEVANSKHLWHPVSREGTSTASDQEDPLLAKSLATLSLNLQQSDDIIDCSSVSSYEHVGPGNNTFSPRPDTLASARKSNPSSMKHLESSPRTTCQLRAPTASVSLPHRSRAPSPCVSSTSSQERSTEHSGRQYSGGSLERKLPIVTGQSGEPVCGRVQVSFPALLDSKHSESITISESNPLVKFSREHGWPKHNNHTKPEHSKLSTPSVKAEKEKVLDARQGEETGDLVPASSSCELTRVSSGTTLSEDSPVSENYWSCEASAGNSRSSSSRGLYSEVTDCNRTKPDKSMEREELSRESVNSVSSTTTEFSSRHSSPRTELKHKDRGTLDTTSSTGVCKKLPSKSSLKKVSSFQAGSLEIRKKSTSVKSVHFNTPGSSPASLCHSQQSNHSRSDNTGQDDECRCRCITDESQASASSEEQSTCSDCDSEQTVPSHSEPKSYSALKLKHSDSSTWYHGQEPCCIDTSISDKSLASSDWMVTGGGESLKDASSSTRHCHSVSMGAPRIYSQSGLGQPSGGKGIVMHKYKHKTSQVKEFQSSTTTTRLMDCGYSSQNPLSRMVDSDSSARAPSDLRELGREDGKTEDFMLQARNPKASQPPPRAPRKSKWRFKLSRSLLCGLIFNMKFPKFTLYCR